MERRHARRGAVRPRAVRGGLQAAVGGGLEQAGAVAPGDDRDAAGRARRPTRGGRAPRSARGAQGVRRRQRRRCAARTARQDRARAVGRRVPRLAVPHRRARPPRRMQGPAQRRGSLVRLGRLDPRRLLLPEAQAAARVQGRRQQRSGRHDRRRLRRARGGGRGRVPRRRAQEPPRAPRHQSHRRREDGGDVVLTNRPRRASCTRSSSTVRCVPSPTPGGCRSCS